MPTNIGISAGIGGAFGAGGGASSPAAPMGYMGRVSVFGIPVRAASMSVDAKQPITIPDPVSNIPEQPMWHVGPVRVEGDITFPMTSDPGMRTIFVRALDKKRQGQGQAQLEAGEILVEWPPGQGGGEQSFGRKFSGCVANRLMIKGTAGERLDVTVAILGVGVDDEAIGPAGFGADGFDMSRVISWDMVEINGTKAGNAVANSCSIREFSVEIDNGCSHNFTFNFPEEDATFVTARSITTGRRQVTGSLSFLGTAPTQETAKKNLITAIPEDQLLITVAPPRETNISVFESGASQPGEVSNIEMKFNRIVYEWQDLSLSSGVVMSRVDWRAHGDGPGTAAAEFTF